MLRYGKRARARCRTILEGHADDINGIAFSPDGKHVATAGGDDTIRIWQTTAGQFGIPLHGHDGPVVMAVFSRDGKTLLSGGTRDKSVRLWDLTTFKVKMVMQGHEAEVRFIGFGEKGTIVSLSKDGVVKLWNADGKEKASFLWEREPSGKLPAYATSVAISPDGKTLAVGHDDVVDVWDLSKVNRAK